MSLHDCFVLFADCFLIDIGVGELERLVITAKTLKALTVYNANKPTNSVAEIATNLYDCVVPNSKSIARSTGQQTESALFYLIVITGIYVLIVSMMLIILMSNGYNELAIAMSVIFFVLYLIIAYLIIKNNSIIIINNITNAENEITHCVDTAVTALQTFEAQQTTAISLALCNYGMTCSSDSSQLQLDQEAVIKKNS